MGFAGALREEFDLPVQVDWNALEFALGINSSLEEFWNRAQKLTDRAAEMLREFDLDLFACGSHPVEPMFNSAHVHVGTIHDEAAGIRLENALMKYVPAFGALAANSPCAHGWRDGFKSHRIRQLAHGCTRPIAIRDPETSQEEWGSDAGPKIYGAPTLEVRIGDCASSRRVLAEYATFVAAYVHHRGTIQSDAKPSERDYRESLTNRWAAARYGLQATFAWNGVDRPAAEVIDEMLDECSDELAALGAKRGDLRVLTEMVEKRICQADLAGSIMDRYPDDYCLASAYGKLIRQWDVFEEYLQSAPALDPAPPIDEDAVMAEHLSFIGEGTYFYRLRDAMHYSAPAADEILERMIERQLVTREVTSQYGILLNRVEQ